VTLNIDAKLSAATTRAQAKVRAKASRLGGRALRAEVLDELTSWNPREFIAAFQRWHLGSMSLIHLNVLTLLEAMGPVSMSRLAEALDVSLASMTGLVDRMESRGLVERRHDAKDRRVVLVHPSEGGRQMFVDIDRRRRTGLAKLLSYLTDEDLAGLLQGHRALRDARQRFATTMTARKVPGSELVAVETKK
jgi:DNA-binding MarR family transcriptional regulator